MLISLLVCLPIVLFLHFFVWSQKRSFKNNVKVLTPEARIVFRQVADTTRQLAVDAVLLRRALPLRYETDDLCANQTEILGDEGKRTL